MSERQIELLSPAKNLETAQAAILAGADAVYMGSPKFGARASAANSIDDIAEAANFAHKFGAKLYIALNTILTDAELKEAVTLARELDEAKADALIIQDMGLVARPDMPSLPLHASTQCNISSPQKAKFLEDIGAFETIVIAREMTLDETSKISNVANCRIESFIHGALCVSYSGECYLSAAIGGRSGNRGACAQPCREIYSLVDADKKIITRGHLLSLKDMNRAKSIGEMLDCGVSSFKIEGRLKDVGYVENITAYYRKILDLEIGKRGLKRSSFGESKVEFFPAPEKSFNREFCDCGLKDSELPRKSGRAAFDTPKSKGEYIGRVKRISPRGFECDSSAKISNGDGLYFVPQDGNWEDGFGGFVNFSDSGIIRLGRKDSETALPEVGMKIWRNFNSEFEKLLKRPISRKIGLDISVEAHGEQAIKISAIAKTPDMEFVEKVLYSKDYENAKNSDAAKNSMAAQLKKFGNTIFRADSVIIGNSEFFPFMRAAQMNEIRRELAAELENRILDSSEKRREKSKELRAQKNERIRKKLANALPKKIEISDLCENVANAEAEKFYAAYGLSPRLPRSPEISKTYKGLRVMRSRHCVLRELGLCKMRNSQLETKFREPLRLVSDSASLILKTDCNKCETELFFE